MDASSVSVLLDHQYQCYSIVEAVRGGCFKGDLCLHYVPKE